MTLDQATILAQIDDLLREFAQARDASPYDDLSGGLPDHEMVAIATRFLSAISRLTPPDSEYLRKARAVEGHEGYVVQQLGGILQALRADVAAGYTQRLEELVHASVFADFLDMADELQRAGYKDAAAVITGSTLEEHLRKLAVKNQVSVENPNGSPKKADTLNADLAKAPVYSPLDQKSVTAWLDLRNRAAHGKYSEYDHAQVAALIRDVRGFAARHPA